MKEPILVVMAAGLGSRYGGMKQIDPMGAHGEIIMDYSLYDALQAGFRRVIFIIKEEHLSEFEALLAKSRTHFDETRFAFQKINDLPEGFSVPKGREKPWGTGHAVLSCRELIDAPFAVINADDFYGRHAFQEIYTFLKNEKEPAPGAPEAYAMVGYQIKNTVTDNGHVARGVCSVNSQGLLTEIHERTRIETFSDKIAYTEDDGKTWITLAPDTPVSLNLWGFSQSFMNALKREFPLFLEKTIVTNPLKGEFFLPFVVDTQLQSGKATVQVLHTPEKWYGVTYREDKPVVTAAIGKMTASGVYPAPLWKE